MFVMKIGEVMFVMWMSANVSKREAGSETQPKITRRCGDKPEFSLGPSMVTSSSTKLLDKHLDV